MTWLTETKVDFGTWMPQTDLETSSVFFFFKRGNTVILLTRSQIDLNYSKLAQFVAKAAHFHRNLIKFW